MEQEQHENHDERTGSNREPNSQRVQGVRGAEPDYASWSQGRAKQQYDSIKRKHGGEWKEMLKAFDWAEDPEAALATLEKKATGKWPAEK